MSNKTLKSQSTEIALQIPSSSLINLFQMKIKDLKYGSIYIEDQIYVIIQSFNFTWEMQLSIANCDCTFGTLYKIIFFHQDTI